MDPTLDGLVDRDVLHEDADEFSLGEGFLARLGRIRDEVADAGSAAAVDRLVDEYEATLDGPLLDVLADDRDLLVAALGVIERLPDLAVDELVQAVQYVDLLQRPLPPIDGVPEPFLPVPGDRLTPYLGLNRVAVVYVWRHDCDPCDVMREEFESMADELSPEMALFAVYGPDSVEHLQDRYGVQGGPTTLFVVDGEVDARLQGAHYPEAIEHEFEQLERYL